MLRFCLAFVLFAPSLAIAADLVEGPVNVIDADTWYVGDVRVRLHGIDAPELGQNCETNDDTAWVCGNLVTQEVRRRFHGKSAQCTPLDRDRYGRVVARCRVIGRDVGRELVRHGLAFAYRKYSTDYAPEEALAASERAGLHSAHVQPWVHRASGTAQLSGPCRIKGNISSAGERIYHAPGQKHYSKTRISLSREERWFCSEAEAAAAGWRKAAR
ncbi:thermonuclease family protein [Ruegeria sp. EL01]|jgi:endonuclease YncB( thermonuclease family)|uniref:thermonuclease family protein n=1 Tax=Ruegeria sp. EL01 TaxID=2107578 RepID=UPI000EA80EFC|nr:thermonuclease family protein [Ruegeria sp. EL01]